MRYVSQSDEKEAVQGGFDVNHSTGLYISTWGSNVDFNECDNGCSSDEDPSMELDIYGSWGHEFGNGLGVDVGIIQYLYLGTHNLNFVEYYAGLRYTRFGVGLSGSANHSNNALDGNDPGTFYTATAEYTFVTWFPITIGGDRGGFTVSKQSDRSK